MFVTQDGTGWVVGLHGLIGMKEENDSDWSLLLSGDRDEISSIYFINENIGWASVKRSIGNNPHQHLVLKTTNGGKLWKSQLENIFGSYPRCVYFINELFGWVAYSDRALQTDVGGGLYRTTDGGENWIRENTAGQYSSVFFINQDIGWVTSDNLSLTGIYKRISTEE